VARRKRYDTEQLVSEIQADRRNTILLALAGVGIVVVLVALYVSGAGEEDVPEIPPESPIAAPVEPAPAEAEATPEAKDEAPAEEVEEAVEEAPAAPSKVHIGMTKKGRLWIDGKLIGKKVRSHKMELAAGSHTLKAKFGRKVVNKTIEIEGDGAYTIKVIHRKKRVVVKKKK